LGWLLLALVGFSLGLGIVNGLGDLILTLRTGFIGVLARTRMGGSWVGFGGMENRQTRVNEFGSVLLGNEGGVANGPTSSVDWGDGLNFHEPKILTMRRSGVDLVKYVGITRRQIRVGLFAGWCRNWSMNRLLLVLLLAPFSMAAQSTLNDLDGDGCVGATDILVILGQYGECQDTTAAFACGDSVLFDNYWYETVLIGDQCWFAENLRTTVYADGTVIPAGLTDGEWVSTISGATAVYGEGSSGCDNYSPDIDACDEAQSLVEYGRLYNWYAVDDARGLCPSGWHVPSDSDWISLELALGMDESEAISEGFRGDVGGLLKATHGWWLGEPGGNPPQEASNSTGFTGLPGGMKNFGIGYDDDGGIYGCWWTSSPSPSIENAWNRLLYWYTNHIVRQSEDYWTNRNNGLSVRCLKDPE